MSVENKCKRCGTCCENGGPALHSQDISLIEKGLLAFEEIITIRKGELVDDPVTKSIAPAKNEFLKVKGSKGSWSCTFYDKSRNQCSRYEHRPFACGVLKCWDTKEILDLAGKDLLSRLDIIKENNPLTQRLIEHESLFPVPDLKGISRTISRSSKKTIKKLERMCNKDIAHRIESVDTFHLCVNLELFYFGRPIFEMLTPLGFDIRETASGIKLKFR
ncbi:Putative zinc-or iron-chelating domain-containing protein [Desulfocicer vacuolatum DSM 3385]|uniref:Putative zinc-or iron-chelating domain-containing protein n=1 Tax=Desulfocicer vacuolatum DSM 3385 TaxID=1121400 RepID=A0A1W2AK45_9BACT|nr:YkgJ family cysteine cluster protein [Desulfocicer vacuolatum]SMC61047.1 Putative zinc-or iron-chelating domain-containing protein [Desulfocicer vacuolatum DSM 3385]